MSLSVVQLDETLTIFRIALRVSHLNLLDRNQLVIPSQMQHSNAGHLLDDVEPLSAELASDFERHLAYGVDADSVAIDHSIVRSTSLQSLRPRTTTETELPEPETPSTVIEGDLDLRKDYLPKTTEMATHSRESTEISQRRFSPLATISASQLPIAASMRDIQLGQCAGGGNAEGSLQSSGQLPEDFGRKKALEALVSGS